MRKNWIWGLSLLLIGGMASCKSSQSAYKAAYEKAQEKKIEEPVTTGTTPVAEQPVVTTPSTTTTTAPIREQSEKINAVDGNDALLKSYNVIVGSFRQRLNAQSLCERLRADGSCRIGSECTRYVSCRSLFVRRQGYCRTGSRRIAG